MPKGAGGVSAAAMIDNAKPLSAFMGDDGDDGVGDAPDDATTASLVGDGTGTGTGPDVTGNEELSDAGLEAPTQAADGSGDAATDDERLQMAAEEDSLLDGSEDAATVQAAAQAKLDAKAKADADAAKPPDAPAVDTEMARQAALGKRFEERFASNPAELMGNLLQSMSPEQVRFALETAGISHARIAPESEAAKPTLLEDPAENDPVYAGLTGQEAWVEKNRGTIEKSMGLINELPTQLMQALTMRDEVYSPAVIEAHAARHENKILAEALGIKLPEFDAKAFHEAVQSGKSVNEAVAMQYEKPKADILARVKQKQAERPNTPGASAPTNAELPKGASLFATMRAIFGDSL